MGDEEYTFNVKQVDIASGFSEQESTPGSKKERKKQHEHTIKSMEHFDEIKSCAENANTILEGKSSPYRLHVYRVEKDIFVDLVILDKNKKIKQTVRKNITHDELMKSIEQIETLDGFFVDCKV